MLSNKKRFDNDHKSVLPMSKVQAEAKAQIEAKIESGQYSFIDLPCCVCNTNNLEVIAKKDCYGIYCPAVICKTCGLVGQNPKLSQESCNELHDKEYRNLYAGENNSTAAKHYFDYQRILGEDIFNYIKVNSPISFSKKRVLEIGCGAGGILAYFQEQGSEVFGVDPAPDYVNYGKEQGLNLQVATLKDAKIPWQPDLIIYNNVMEHLIDPVAELKTLAGYMNKDTLLYIGVPNLKSLVRKYGSDLLKFIEIAHTFYFTLESLQNVLHRSGYAFLQGSQGAGLRTIFMLSEKNIAGTPVKNDYAKTMLFLQHTEKYRLVPTAAKVIFWGKKTFVLFLKKTGLFHWFFQKVYRKTSL